MTCSRRWRTAKRSASTSIFRCSTPPTRCCGRMKRPGTRASYERLLDRIRGRLPGVTLRTTFIVGFPGESETDVDELQSFVDAMKFDHIGVFTYSHEEGTSAHALEDDVPAAVKRRRRSRLMSSQKRAAARAQKARVGQRVRRARRRSRRRARARTSSENGRPGSGHRPDRLSHGRRPIRGLTRAVSHRGSGRQPRVRPPRPRARADPNQPICRG